MSRSGIAAQIGWASESPFGTYAAPDRFVPLISETLSKDVARLESDAIRAGRFVLDDDDWAAGDVTVGGGIELELYAHTIGELLEHLFGQVSTTGSGPFTHTFTPATTFGKSLTVQVGRPGVGGTVHPFSYTGVKVASAELSCQVGQFARLNLDVVGEDETTGESLASVSYNAAIKPLRFTQATVSLAGSPFSVRSANLTIANAMDTDRRFLGTDTIAEPIDNELREITGELDAEFTDLTAYDRFINGTQAALVLTFSDGTNSLAVTLNVRFDGTTPNVGGRGIVRQPLPFKAVGSTDAAAITAVLINTDATA